MCDRWDGCLHPVGFLMDDDTPKEIRNAVYSTESELGPYICHECMDKYIKWIFWYG